MRKMYPSSIHLPLFLFLVYSPLSISISSSIQIHAYLFQSRFHYLNLFFVYSPIFVSIYCLSTSISLYLFINIDWRLSLSSPFSLPQSNPHLSTSISFYLFVNPNSRLSLSIPFSLSLSIFLISTYICFYLLSIHVYFIIPLYQYRLTSISFKPIFFISV